MAIITKLKSYETKNKTTGQTNGRLVSLWNENFTNYKPGQFYVVSCEPFEMKGAHNYPGKLDNFICLQGKVLFIVKGIKGKYEEFLLDAKNPEFLQIPAGEASAHINIGVETALVANICSPGWKEDVKDGETDFGDYSWDSVIQTCEYEFENVDDGIFSGKQFRKAYENLKRLKGQFEK
mgnify:CR=1 FL=1